MTSQSLSNFYIELRAVDSVKFDNDCYIILLLITFLGDLATVIQTNENAITTNQEMTLLLNGCPRTISEMQWQVSISVSSSIESGII